MEISTNLKWLTTIASMMLVLAGLARAGEQAQVVVSATPALISLPSPIPFSAQSVTTATATRTATVEGPVLLEALTEANVRVEPDPESELLGTIRAGDLYPVLGRYFRWFQFQYDQAPSGTGWVFDELVRIEGDEGAIRDLTQDALPTVDFTAQGATQTMAVVTQTPGGILTVTAGALIFPALGQPELNTTTQPQPGTRAANFLPTFTYPPEVALVPPDAALRVDTVLDATPTPASENFVFSVSEGVPPIVPILLLGGFGLLGLLVSSRRR